MPDHLFPRTNGTSTSREASDERSMAELGRDLAELARNLSGSLHSLYVRSGDREIQVEWDHTPAEVKVNGAALPTLEATAPDTLTDDSATVSVRSPLVGTYYAAPAPDAAPFVSAGDTVEHGQTVAIVEAMKMMNPVVAEQAGVVAEILVANGAAVEFDQPLITLLPQGAS